MPRASGPGLGPLAPGPSLGPRGPGLGPGPQGPGGHFWTPGRVRENLYQSWGPSNVARMKEREAAYKKQQEDRAKAAAKKATIGNTAVP